MLDTLKQLLGHQYDAAVGMLYLCVARCPEQCWNERVANWKFC